MTKTIERIIRPRAPQTRAVGRARPAVESALPKVSPATVTTFLDHLMSHPLPNLPTAKDTTKKLEH